MSAPVAHPAWCDPARCEVAFGRAHSSDVMVVERDRHSAARLSLRLWQPRSFGDSSRLTTLCEVIVGDHEQAVRVRTDLSLGQADALRRHLGTLIAMTEAGE